jgi:glycosyltransferase involved in cell wall biosynthesis
MKVLLMLDHAPDYRETFLRELGKYVELTVGAQPCEQDGLSPPDSRAGYEYFDLPSRRCMGLYWQAEATRLFCRKTWDVICFDLNLRHLTRLYLFFRNTSYRQKWIWRGHIFGRSDSKPVQLAQKYFLQHSAGCLAYSEPVAERVSDKFNVHAVSFNNTQVRKDEFRPGIFDEHSELRLLFVGRNQPRKKLERLIELAERRKDVYIRLIGPEMESLHISSALKKLGRVKVYCRTTGKELNAHFDWSDLVANPGHVGLLTLHAAQHGKGIVIDNNSRHAPEYWIAKEAGQPFISFGCTEEVDSFVDHVLDNRGKLRQWGSQLQKVAMLKYTVEYMAEAHYKVFAEVASNLCMRKND